jgi:hypothetical protein
MAVVKCGAWQGDSRRCDRLGGLQPPETRFQAQRPEGAQVDLGKAQVIDSVPKVIKELKFGVLYAVHSGRVTQGDAIG